MVRLLQIAAAAEELHIRIGVAASLGHRHDVIELKIVIRTALGTAPAVALPYALPDVTRDVPGEVARRRDFCLVRHGNSHLKDRVRYGRLPI